MHHHSSAQARPLRAYLFLLLTMLFFSGNILVGKAVNELPPFTISFCRVSIAFLVVLPIGLRQALRYRRNIAAQWRPVLAMALTGIAFFNALIYAALRFTSTTNVAILEASIPVVTVLFSALFLHERLNPLQWLGVLLSLGGAVWVITGGAVADLAHRPWNTGDGIMIAAVLIWVGYSLLVKKHIAKLPRYGGLLVMLAIAILALLPAAALETSIFGVPDLTRPDLALGLFYLGVFPSVLALLLYNRAIEEVGPSRAALFLNLLPVFTMAGAYLFLNEAVSPAQLLGALVVIAGVTLTIRAGNPTRRD